jgi:acyl-CoA thioesterase-1
MDRRFHCKHIGSRLGVLIAALLISGCTSSERTAEAPGQAIDAPASDAAPPASSTADLKVRPTPRPRIVALGDSLTAGLGLDPRDAYPALLQRRIDDAGFGYEVVNAGVSGETSAGGLRRIDWALEGDVRILIVALGGNDALRGLPVEQLQQNLSAIIERAQGRGIKVILAGMEAPPNFGAAYTAGFRQTYRDVASKHKATLVPFLLDGVAGLSNMNQPDGIHPTAAGARQVAENIWTALEPMLKSE